MVSSLLLLSLLLQLLPLTMDLLVHMGSSIRIYLRSNFPFQDHTVIAETQKVNLCSADILTGLIIDVDTRRALP